MGGAWGIALLAAYMKPAAEGVSLPDFLADTVFAGETAVEIAPDADAVAGFDAYLSRYTAVLPAVHAAVEWLK